MRKPRKLYNELFRRKALNRKNKTAHTILSAEAAKTKEMKIKNRKNNTIYSF